MNRLVDWEQRLGVVIAENRARAHVYGEWDCLLWPAAAVQAVTGKDLGKKHRGKYDSQAKAYRHLKQMGFDTPVDYLASLFPEVPAGFAHRGDIIVAADGIPGVCIGSMAVSIGEAAVGFVGVPREQWARAFAVGERHS